MSPDCTFPQLKKSLTKIITKSIKMIRIVLLNMLKSKGVGMAQKQADPKEECSSKFALYSHTALSHYTLESAVGDSECSQNLTRYESDDVSRVGCAVDHPTVAENGVWNPLSNSTIDTVHLCVTRVNVALLRISQIKILPHHHRQHRHLSLVLSSNT